MTNERTLWSNTTREHLEDTATRLCEAIKTYAASIAESQVPLSVDDIVKLEMPLTMAARTFADAHYDHTDEFPPLGIPSATPDEGVEHDPTQLSPELLSVLWRADFDVQNAARVIEAGRSACASLFPEMTQEEIIADVDQLGRALYYLDHSVESALYDVDGLRPIAATKWFLGIDNAMTEAELDDDEFYPFDLAEDAESRVIYTITDL